MATPVATTRGVVYIRGWSGTLTGASLALTGDLALGASGTLSWSAQSEMTSPSDGVVLLSNTAGTGFSRLQLGGTTSSFPALKRNGTGIDFKLADDSAYTTTTAKSFLAVSGTVTNGSGTGITVVDGGQLLRQVYKVTIAKEAFVAAATTADVTIATLPAKTVLLGVYANLTATFALGADTLAMTLGSSAGASDYLASFDAKTATGWFGDADGEMGTALARAAAVQGGALSVAGNIVSLRLTSSATNIGDGAATSLTTGSITFYLVTERLP